MIKKLKSSGNGWELYFTKPLLKLIGCDPNESKVLITANNGVIYFSPILNSDVEKYKNNMVRKFQKSGSGYAVYFPLELAEILEIDPATGYLDINIKDNVLEIKKSGKTVEE